MTSGSSDDARAAHELDLITRASTGDVAAFDRIFERHGAGVQLLVERLLGPGETADTVVVEAFQKTVRRLPLLGARSSSPHLYLLTTARNTAYASLGRSREAGDQPQLAALLTLPSRQRELLALRELGLSEVDAGKVAGVEPDAVHAQIARARVRIVDELEGTSYSGAFVDPRAEALLGAVVARRAGDRDPALDEELNARADGDARFAAALTAVRSPSRSVGQLPPATGAARLAAAARAMAVPGSAPVAAPPPAPAADAPAAPAPSGADGDPDAAAPTTPPAASSSPYDDEIGDAAAWGIVDDDADGDAGFSADADRASGADRPSAGDGGGEDDVWSPGGPLPRPLPPLPDEPDQAEVPAAQTGPVSDDDVLAGLPDLELHGDDEPEWGSGEDHGPGYVPEPAPVGPPRTADPDATRPFDAVDLEAIARGAELSDEPAAGRRRVPRVLLWLAALVLLVAGSALAVYAVTVFAATGDDEPAPPATTQPAPTGSGDGAGDGGSSSDASSSSSSDAGAGTDTDSAASSADSAGDDDRTTQLASAARPSDETRSGGRTTRPSTGATSGAAPGRSTSAESASSPIAVPPAVAVPADPPPPADGGASVSSDTLPSGGATVGSAAPLAARR